MLRASSLLLALLVALAAVADPGPIEGLWLVEDGEARVRIARCGAAHCGKIVWLRDPLDEKGQPWTDGENDDPALRDRPVLGLEILRFPARPEPDGVWRGGRIYDPKSGNTYRCSLELEEPDVLRMRGYLAIPLFGRSTRWSRVADDTEARSAR
jgi:uncharacterized protein (DUF2147 family)